MRRIPVFIILILASLAASAAVRPASTSVKKKPAHKTVKKSLRAKPKSVRPAPSRSPWKEPTYADSTAGDSVDGEDLEVRRAAVAALGPYNGAVVVSEAETGRILSIVNQPLALSGAYQPCSTIKLVTALAALQERLIPLSGPFELTSRALSGLTHAMAQSSNWYFASLGQKLGFPRVIEYARRLGLGEKAGWEIEGERPGVLPAAPPRDGGVGMMASFGSGIAVTPLELAALIGAVANGGTLYYLQYPRSAREAAALTPRVKRELEIGPWLDELKEGMRAAVERGTARRASAEADEPVFGKTGTCTDFGRGAHMGWFGSFAGLGGRNLVVVVMLTGARGVSGPVASGIAGRIFAELSRRNYSLRASRPAPPPSS